MAEYINYKMENKFKDFLKSELIRSFKISYNVFMSEIIATDIENNL